MIHFRDKLGYKNHGRLLGWGSGPDADWRVMFSVLLIFILIAVIFSVQNFLNIWSGSFDAGVSAGKVSTIDKNLLQKEAAYYTDKQTQFNLTLTTKDTTPDPSK